MGMAILLTLVVTRFFGSGSQGHEQAGLYFYASTVMVAIATITRYGAETLALKLTAADPELGRPWARPALLLTTGLSIPGAAVVTWLVGSQKLLQALPHGSGWLLAAAIGTAMIPLTFISLGGAWLRALGKVAIGSFLELGAVPTLSVIALIAAGLSGNRSLVFALIVMAASYWLSGLGTLGLALPLLRRSAPTARSRSVKDYLREHGRILFSVMATAVGFYCYSYLAILFLGLFHWGEFVAYFNTARTFANFVPLLATLQISMLSPQFASLQHADDLDGASRVNWRATALATGFGALVAVPLLVFPEQVLRLAGDYAGAAPLLRCLTITSLLVTALGQVYSLMLTGKGMEVIAGRITFAVLGVTIVIMLLCLPLGPAWIAFAATLAPLLFAVTGHIVLKKRGIRSALWQRPPGTTS